MIHRAGPSFVLPLVALIFGGLAFAALLDASVVATGGRFEYPLDDTYIHLAMAEQLAMGGYGVNTGEYAAASSSPLFSFLLVPFAGEPFQRFLPLIWNVVGLVASLILWGRILWQTGWGMSPLGYAFAAVAPIALNVPGVAFVGMEHSLHVAATLAIVSGLIRFVDEGRIGWLLVAGVFLAPVLRLEGVALAGLAGLFVLAQGRIKAGLILGALSVVPLSVFAYWLTTLGLEPLPSSVSAKLVDPNTNDKGFVAIIAGKIVSVFDEPRAGLLALMLLFSLALMALPRVKHANKRGLLIVIFLAGLAHLMVGRFGWMDRYEVYVIVAATAGLLAATAGSKRLSLMPVVVVVLSGWLYVGDLVFRYSDAPNAVANQQVQMGRFAKEHWKRPVAVNDLGYVAWQNTNYVLDLWGLANHEARQGRIYGQDRLWAVKLIEKHDAEIAMIYENWFPKQLGDDWQLLGRLKLQVPIGYLAGTDVSFFLTHGGDTGPAIAQLRNWTNDMPAGAKFVFAGEDK